MNPATRVLKITDIINKKSFKENANAIEAWSTILTQTKDEGKQLTEAEIFRRLIALTDQLEQLAYLLKAKSAPPHLYEDAFLSIQRGLSPAQLTQRWMRVKTHFSPEAITTLRWSEWVIGSLEETITEDDRQAVRSQINELQDLLQATSLPEPMVKILETQIAALTEALQDYEIYGIEPFEKAIKIVTSDLVASSEEITSAKKSNPKDTNQILSKINSMMNTALSAIDKAGKTAGSLEKLWNMSKQALEYGSSSSLPPMG